MSHTPGPWKVIQDQYGVVEFIWGDTGCVCDLRSPRETTEVFDGWMGPTKPANARLIAAAPDLYEALEAAYMVLTSQKTRLEEHVDAVTLARAALAKARGDEGEENA